MVHLKDPRWKLAAVDPFDAAAVRCEDAIRVSKELEAHLRRDIEEYKALEKEAYKVGLDKVVEMGNAIHVLYGRLLSTEETRHDIEDAWRKWDITTLNRMGIIDSNLAKAMREAPVEQ